MKDDESIQDMHTRFTSIINELHSLGEIIPRNKPVRKILSVLPDSWESKVNVITEAKDLQKLTIDELIRNLKTYEMKKKKDHERRDPKKEKNMVLKIDNNDQVALAAWGGSSNESAEVDEQGDSYMMAVESEAAEYNSIFALMVEVDEDEEDDDDDEVNFPDVQRNLKSYSQKKLISLGNVLFDAYHNLINDKNALTMELREIENERDDLVVVVVDLKKTYESLKKEKDTLDKRITNIEHERDDLLAVVVDLKETIKELRRKSRHETTQKGKEVTSEGHLRLENELKSVKSSLCAEFERNRQLQEDLGKGPVKGSSQRWYIDSGCSKNMNGRTNDFLSLKYLQGGSVSFGNGKIGYILGVGRIGKSLTQSIENMYYVNGWK
ncbi:uncharacterized protein [Nicotiana sylvestris]|uniref:Kinesin-related protein 4-like n=1 Tax=Nicotiana sylvestris TaxID=4096 RepID=A0A1U7XWC1_NICSY|nr:PREDICTED: kinesin-related protein 4-like [Nicotiana sylvestris]